MMRIVVWNCAMKLRGEKLNALEDLRAGYRDRAGCECPQELWGKQPLLAPIPMEWIGDNEHKGLGGARLQRLPHQEASQLRPKPAWMLPSKSEVRSTSTSWPSGL